MIATEMPDDNAVTVAPAEVGSEVRSEAACASTGHP